MQYACTIGAKCGKKVQELIKLLKPKNIASVSVLTAYFVSLLKASCNA
jgi:hypothetical protein